MKKHNKIEISSKNKLIKQKSNVRMQESPKIGSNQYHLEEIKQNKMIVTNAVIMIWAGFILLSFSIILYLLNFTQSFLPGVIGGGIIDFLSSIVLFLFNKSNENKQKYFNDLLKSEREDKIIKLVKDSENISLEDELIKKLMSQHFK